MAKGKGGGYLLKGLTRKNPPQMAKGDPMPPTKSVNEGAISPGTAKTPKTLGPRYI